MKALVKMHGIDAGVLKREGDTVTFQYDANYPASGKPALSFSLPLRQAPYTTEGLHPYFSGLVSEGWLKRIQSFEQGIHPDDDFLRLVKNGKDLAGAVTIEEMR